MALFSDGPFSTIEDLAQHDSSLVSVASTEGIDVTAKLNLAYNEIGVELNAIFAREGSIYAPVLGLTLLDTDHVVVTQALKLWHSFRALELVYRDAYFNQLNDRYKGKWTEFQNLARWSAGKFLDVGVGLVSDPIPIPGPPSTTLQAAAQSGGTIYLTVSFTNQSGQEGLPAVLSQVEIPDQNVLIVSPPSAPANAVGWNLYAGPTPDSLSLQNSQALDLGGTTTISFPGLSGGRPPGAGQTPDITRDLPRRIMRG
jgi:hypothetical protein